MLRLSHLETLDSGAVVLELYLEEHICILEESFLQTDDQELTHWEVFPDHQSYVLRMTQVQSTVDLIQDVQWRRLVFQQS